MGVPGSNLLRQALKVIKPTTIKYVKFNGRVLNAARIWVDSYDEPVDLKASVQAVPREKYQDLGLDLQKNYIKIWASKDLVDLKRNYSGDYFIYGTTKYKLSGETPWFLQDGWASAIAIDIGEV